MIVAAGALEGEAEEGGGEGLHAVRHILHAILLLHAAALGLLLVQAVKSGGENLIVGRFGQEVAGELRGDELVEGKVVVERFDDPIAPRPHLALAIHLEAVAVGVARDVQPVHGHAFAEVRRGEEAVNEVADCRLPIADWRILAQERFNLGGRRREAGEVETQAAQERGGVGFGLEFEFAGGEGGGDKGVEGVRWEHRRLRPRGSGCGRGRPRSFGQRHKRPVRLILGALGDPAAEQNHLGGRQTGKLGFRRRHVVVRVLRGDTAE